MNAGTVVLHPVLFQHKSPISCRVGNVYTSLTARCLNVQQGMYPLLHIRIYSQNSYEIHLFKQVRYIPAFTTETLKIFLKVLFTETGQPTICHCLLHYTYSRKYRQLFIASFCGFSTLSCLGPASPLCRQPTSTCSIFFRLSVNILPSRTNSL